MRARVGDVVRTTAQLTRFSFRHRCPVCTLFIHADATECSQCGSQFVRLSASMAEVTFIGHR